MKIKPQQFGSLQNAPLRLILKSFHHNKMVIPTLLLISVLYNCQCLDTEKKQEYILAGISDGLYEYKYNPPKKLSYSYFEPGLNGLFLPDTFRIDLDDDSHDDIMLISDGTFSSGTDLRASYVSTLNTNTYIALTQDTNINVKKFNYGDTIDKNHFWSNDRETKFILSYFYAAMDYPTIIKGEWENNSTNYFAIFFKEENQLGWCKLSININKDITIFSYAIQK